MSEAPMMYVLHVSHPNTPMHTTRLMFGCEDAAAEVDEKLLMLGYTTWNTYEEAPERDSKEMEDVQALLMSLF